MIQSAHSNVLRADDGKQEVTLRGNTLGAEAAIHTHSRQALIAENHVYCAGWLLGDDWVSSCCNCNNWRSCSTLAELDVGTLSALRFGATCSSALAGEFGNARSHRVLNNLGDDRKLHRRDALWQVGLATHKVGPLFEGIYETEGSSGRCSPNISITIPNSNVHRPS